MGGLSKRRIVERSLPGLTIPDAFLNKKTVEWEQIKNLFIPASRKKEQKDGKRNLIDCKDRCALASASRTLCPWKTVYSRFCKWRDAGTLQMIVETLCEGADRENLCLDSNFIRVHQHAAEAKKHFQRGKKHCSIEIITR